MTKHTKKTVKSKKGTLMKCNKRLLNEMLGEMYDNLAAQMVVALYREKNRIKQELLK